LEVYKKEISMSKNDVAIKELLKKVEEQKESLGSKERVTWLTNGIFKKDGTSHLNINTVTDGLVLATALGFILNQEASFLQACKELDVKGEFRWDGYTVEEWKEDFKTRMRVIEYDKKKKLLDATKAKLNMLVSEEARTEMELEDIKKILG
jgi:hypothetical protein